MNQKLKTVIKYIILTVVVMTGAFFYSFVKMNGTAIMQSGNTATFRCKGENLNTVKVKLLPETELSGNVDFFLTDEVGNEIKHITKDKSDISDDGQIKFSFNKIKNSKDKVYSIKIVTDRNENLFAQGSEVQYSYVGFRLETMIVFVLCIAYLIGLAKTLSFIFRK